MNPQIPPHRPGLGAPGPNRSTLRQGMARP